ncbi:MAG: hypothetical protein JXA91_01160 [Candidatus Thermoplasmatota archaeon]|nr:hypothetical protein [Candidatus Thermoplasmatota archaeon]
MEIKFSADSIKKYSDDSLVIKTVLKPEIVVSSGIDQLNNLNGGFIAGKVTLIDGNSPMISEIPTQLCVNTYKTFHSSSIYIDGGTCANPYKIARYARMMELNQKKTLDHIYISRAFTAHQLSTLINELLEQAIEQYAPLTFVIGNFPFLYQDNDIESREALTLMYNDLKKIRELTTRNNLITVLTHIDNGMFSTGRNFDSMLCKDVDEVMKIKQQSNFIDAYLEKQGIGTRIFASISNQKGLNKFGMVI